MTGKAEEEEEETRDALRDGNVWLPSLFLPVGFFLSFSFFGGCAAFLTPASRTTKTSSAPFQNGREGLADPGGWVWRQAIPTKKGACDVCSGVGVCIRMYVVSVSIGNFSNLRIKKEGGN